MDEGGKRHTVTRTKMLSSKASSSARDLRISGSVEMLMRIVRACLAMGYAVSVIGYGEFRREGAPTHRVVLHEELQVFDRSELGGFEYRGLCLGIWDKVLGRWLGRAG